MLCPKCGALIADDSVFCSKCGNTPKKTDVSGLQVSQQTVPVEAQIVQTPAPVVAPPIDPAVQHLYSQDAPQGQPMPNTYLVQNILLTVFAVICCFTIFALPTAVTGLVFSGIAQGAIKQNDRERALHYSKLARIFMWISFGIEIVTVVVYILFLLLGVISMANIFQNGLQGNFDFNFDMDEFKDFKDGIWR